jgi:hypothetical protein
VVAAEIEGAKRAGATSRRRGRIQLLSLYPLLRADQALLRGRPRQQREPWELVTTTGRKPRFVIRAHTQVVGRGGRRGAAALQKEELAHCNKQQLLGPSPWPLFLLCSSSPLHRPSLPAASDVRRQLCCCLLCAVCAMMSASAQAQVQPWLVLVPEWPTLGTGARLGTGDWGSDLIR